MLCFQTNKKEEDMESLKIKSTVQRGVIYVLLVKIESVTNNGPYLIELIDNGVTITSTS